MNTSLSIIYSWFDPVVTKGDWRSDTSSTTLIGRVTKELDEGVVKRTATAPGALGEVASGGGAGVIKSAHICQNPWEKC